MIVRIYQTGNLDLMTVGDMLWNADRQSNFHPHASWIHSSAFNTDNQTVNQLILVYDLTGSSLLNGSGESQSLCG